MTAVIFDMDGTLLRLDLDIEEVRTRLATLFAPYGVTRPFRPILARIRGAAREAAERGGDSSALARAGLALLDEWEANAAREARPRAGAAAVLAELRARDVGLGLVTDNGRACVPLALRAAGIDPAWLAAISTRDDVAVSKPDPEGIIKVARALGGQSFWYVGDHPRDVEAARAARAEIPGLRVAGLRGGHAPDERLVAAGADAVISELGEVLTLPGADHGA